jgi:nucleotide-binding universal stress UspA family protein
MTRTARRPAGTNADDLVTRPLTIVIGYDFSPQAALALEEGVTLGAASAPAELHVIGVLGHGGHGLGDTRPLHHISFDETEEMQRKISMMVEEVLTRRGQKGIRVFVHCRIGKPDDHILELAGEVKADLIIVGTHGRTGVERLLVGSVAEKVVRAAPCPVLVMRPSLHDPTGEEQAADARFEPEAACPACVDRRFQTGGAAWWCEAHSKAWVQPHRYSYDDAGMSRLRPDDWILW